MPITEVGHRLFLAASAFPAHRPVAKLGRGFGVCARHGEARRKRGVGDGGLFDLQVDPAQRRLPIADCVRPSPSEVQTDRRSGYACRPGLNLAVNQIYTFGAMMVKPSKIIGRLGNTEFDFRLLQLPECHEQTEIFQIWTHHR